MTSQARIFVADDDPALCLLLRETLQDAGYDVTIASNGDELVRMAQDQPPDLILVDLMMPLMDGFEAIRQLRNDTRTSHLPMIILTARSTSSEVVTGFDSGADDYIVKPYDIDVLLARIRSHLRRAAQLPVRNPLTGMPGNVLLQAELERQLS
jgi:DNA-binding response OmpR family regulator